MSEARLPSGVSFSRVLDPTGAEVSQIYGPSGALIWSGGPTVAPEWYPSDAAAAYPQDDPDTDTYMLLRLAAAVPSASGYEGFYRVNASMAGDPEANGTSLGVLTQAQVVDAVYTHATGAAVGDTVYYAFRAVGTGGSGPFGAERHATLVAAPPVGPVWFSGYPQDNASNDDGILLRVISGDADTLDVYYKMGASMAGDPLTNADGSILGLTPAQIVSAAYNHATGEPHGTVVYYQVRGHNTGGYGPFGSEASATVQVRIPGVPQNVSASRSGDTATITWDPGSPDNETLYRIRQYRRTSPTGSWTLEFTFTNPANDTNVNRSLVDGSQYYWTVRAENAAGSSSYSAASNTITYTVTPGAPTGVSLNYGSDPDSQLTLSWTPPASGTFDGYEIEIVPDASSFTGTPNFTASSSPKTLSPLGDDTFYKARVRAVSSTWGLTGLWSSQDNEWTAPSTPGTPNWSATYPKATGDDRIALQVNAAADADEYQFFVGGVQQVQQVGLSYTKTGLSPNTQYSGLYVKGVNIASIGSPHADAVGAASTSQSRYTWLQVPASFSAVRDAGACPLNEFDLSWSNLNGDGVARSETMTVQRDDGSGYATIDAGVAAGSTGYHDGSAATTTVGYRIKYNSESTYASDTSLGPPCPE